MSNKLYLRKNVYEMAKERLKKSIIRWIILQSHIAEEKIVQF